MTKVQIFHYTIKEEISISELKNRFSNHRRLKVFVEKGCTCVSCGRTGTRLIQCKKQKTNSLHWDVYTDDLIPLTVDHIIPKSLGGADDITNYQPMCSPCNSKKGNNWNYCNSRIKKIRDAQGKTIFTYNGVIFERYDSQDLINRELWRYRQNKAPKKIGTITHIGTNPVSGKVAAARYSEKRSKYLFYDLYRPYLVKVS